MILNNCVCLLFLSFRKLSEKELMTNIKQTETYTLPSGQEVEQENILYTVSRIDLRNIFNF
jgi:SOS response regulatory protein OraA/RecX